MYDDIDEELIKKSVIRTKGGLGLSGLDTDWSQRIIILSWFETATSDLCKAIAEFFMKLYITNIANNNNRAFLQSLVICRLIFLNKFPGLRLIGVGEVLRRTNFNMILL